MKLKINHLQHVGIPVTELEKGITFYESLGFKNVMTTTFLHGKSTGTVAMMQYKKKVVIELYQFPKKELAAIRARTQGNIDHIAFDVSDIDKTFAQLTKAGYTIAEPEPVFLPFWKKGCKYFNLIGPNKERLEFNQIL